MFRRMLMAIIIWFEVRDLKKKERELAQLRKELYK